jgi:geranylgeranyl pyrophosphate synthase
LSSAPLCKTLGTDLQHGKLTLPLIHSIRVLSEPRRSSLLLKLETRRLTGPEVLSVLGETGSADYVLARIDACVRKAAKAVRGVRRSLVKATLLEVPHWIARQVTAGMAKGFACTPV